jgi:hypothetical protein
MLAYHVLETRVANRKWISGVPELNLGIILFPLRKGIPKYLSQIMMHKNQRRIN